MEFEIWFYRGFIAVLLIIIWWYWQQQNKKQEDINKKLFGLFEKTETAITKLNTILEGKEALCAFKHNEVDRRLQKLEDKK